MYQSVIFMPHPPIIMEEFHDPERKKAICTYEGMTLLAKTVAKIRPKTIIYVTPHGNSFSNGTCLLDGEVIAGDLSAFRRSDIAYQKKINRDLTGRIIDAFEEHDFVSVLMTEELAKTYHIKAKLDHGVIVPMSFIDKEYSDYDIVHITPGQTPLEENYFLGKLIKDCVDAYTKNDPGKVMVVISGDMSHALSDSGPYAYHENGERFDHIMREAFNQSSPIELIKLKSEFIEDAAQCGLRSFLMGFGYMDGLTMTSKVVSYEGPFGVGYLCAYLSSDEIIAQNSIMDNKQAISQKSFIPTIENLIEQRYSMQIAGEDEYIKLARMTIEYYVKQHKKMKIDHDVFSESFLNELRSKRSGAFVSIHNNGQLRGCIGTIEANCDHLLDEIMYNAISACSADPRFHSVQEDELKNLDIKVDVLYPIEKIESATELDVRKYGVVVEQGYKRGLLLPNLDGINSVSEQISIAKQKAGIVKGSYDLFRFEVERHEVI